MVITIATIVMVRLWLQILHSFCEHLVYVCIRKALAVEHIVFICMHAAMFLSVLPDPIVL